MCTRKKPLHVIRAIYRRSFHVYRYLATNFSGKQTLSVRLTSKTYNYTIFVRLSQFLSFTMVYNRVRPISDLQNNSGATYNSASSLVGAVGLRQDSSTSSKDFEDFDSLSTVNLEELSYLKLKPFSKLDPTIVRLFNFLNCFGLTVDLRAKTNAQESRSNWDSSSSTGSGSDYSRYLRMIITVVVVIITGEVVYDINLRQSKLLIEQKRSTPLLTFVIVAYSWLTLIIPIFCDIMLMSMGSHLFRFYSRTTATVCNGK